ncbi:hypothetical protein [Mucilaginibacter terrae]|uniref:DUF695 domain-containing protein n=1 Tax=Mucilaginibacter terrae TaxID=1955052 RepID=A0ABU3GML7_9SPHI|nr:hypothetical protein [Mucilaginibacter terrae]MDT3401025.1 hypothetical protein [Mucilaginibacter terrae]
MTVLHKINPLPFISDKQWLSFVRLMTENALALNNRALVKAEIMLTDGGHYPSAYFRLTSELDEPAVQPLLQETSGFSLGFDLDWDEDVIIQPLTPQGYEQDWLNENGIIAVFTYHDIGLRRIIRFLKEELKLWEISGTPKNIPAHPLDWRELRLDL